MQATIKKEIATIAETLKKIRRDFHKNPELSGAEEETMAFIAGILESLGLDVKRNVGGFGITGTLRGKPGGRTIALRSDMDALPITEQRDCDYKSKRPGVMHACGHDMHMAVLIGTAMVLSKMPDKLDGNVKFVFQPAEETVGGARGMMEDGVLRDPKVDAMIGLHVTPDIDVGKVGIKYGTMMASADKVHIVIKGRSGHAAQPHETIDAIWVAAMVINAIHQIVSRRIDPLMPAIISLGMINGGTAPNIIADRVEITGTARSLTADVRTGLAEMIENVIKGVTDSVGADYEYTYTLGPPSLDNDERMTDLVKAAAISALGGENVERINKPTMGGEDFALYLSELPGAFFRLGSGSAENDTRHPLHTEMFDVDDSAIAPGVLVMALSVIKYLKGDDA